MPPTKQEVIDFIKKLPSQELDALIQELQEALEIEPIAPSPERYVVISGAPLTTTDAQYSLLLREAGHNRLEVIKTLRALTGMGLAECKQVIDNLPKTIKEGLSKEEADEWAQRLSASGALTERREE